MVDGGKARIILGVLSPRSRSPRASPCWACSGEPSSGGSAGPAGDRRLGLRHGGEHSGHREGGYLRLRCAQGSRAGTTVLRQGRVRLRPRTRPLLHVPAWRALAGAHRQRGKEADRLPGEGRHLRRLAASTPLWRTEPSTPRPCATCSPESRLPGPRTSHPSTPWT